MVSHVTVKRQTSLQLATNCLCYRPQVSYLQNVEDGKKRGVQTLIHGALGIPEALLFSFISIFKNLLCKFHLEESVP